MCDLAGFDAEFEVLTGHSPFKWQQPLFERLVNGKIPRVCDVPTGLGTTAVIPIWLIALAHNEAPEPSHGRVPRRLVYIVNRRTVVDQATEVVERMRRRLRKPDESAWAQHVQTLRGLAERLRQFTGNDGEPLAVSRLRGEPADNQEWKADPARPAIVIGTVDMIGSKLLFSGYGDGFRMRPHHAGLIGQDTAVVVLTERGEAELRSLSDLVASRPQALAYRTLVLPVEAGGLSDEGLLDGSATEPVPDVGDELGRRERRVLVETAERPQCQRLAGERRRHWREYHAPEDGRRVPKQGTLDDLQRVYRAFIRSTKGKLFRRPPKPRVFHVVGYRRLSVLPPRPYRAFDLRNAEGRWRAIPQTDAVLVAAMVRQRACEAAARDTHQSEGGSEVFVAGHVGNQEVSPPRFSYLPLPTIGHPHANGMIRRVLIAEPHGGDGGHVRWARARLMNASLVDTGQRVQAILTPPARPNEVYPFYWSESHAWSTVTPVALPGYDDGKRTKPERLFLKAVHQAGLPVEAVEEFTPRKAPFWPSPQHPTLYRRPQDYRISYRRVLHVQARLLARALDGDLSETLL